MWGGGEERRATSVIVNAHFWVQDSRVHPPTNLAGKINTRSTTIHERTVRKSPANSANGYIYNSGRGGGEGFVTPIDKSEMYI